MTSKKKYINNNNKNKIWQGVEVTEVTVCAAHMYSPRRVNPGAMPLLHLLNTIRGSNIL